MLVAYVSGHGFGHLTRLGEVLREVRARAPDLPIVLKGFLPEGVVRRAAPSPIEFLRAPVDVGLAQIDALTIDEPGTAALCQAFEATWEKRVEVEAAFLKERRARAVLADVPPLAFAAAARAGIPCVGLANFSWDFIYAHLSKRQPTLAVSAERAKNAYRDATLLLELPFSGGLSAFPAREEVGLVARRPRVGREVARARLSLGEERRPVVLVSFGGIGLGSLEKRTLERDGPDLRFVLPEEVDEKRLEESGLDYPDVVGASDVVLTKPGYGIVSDAIGAGVGVVYTDRGDFPEYPLLVRDMPRWLSCEHVPSEDLRAGRGVAGAIRRVLGRPMLQKPVIDGGLELRFDCSRFLADDSFPVRGGPPSKNRTARMGPRRARGRDSGTRRQ